MSKFFKTSEFAPGIPDKNVKAKLPTFNNPQKWEYVLQSHQAETSHHHYDLRLGDPATGQGHSWVVRSWPTPGEKTLAIQQMTHTIPYFDFSGVIKSGYGKGTVDIADRDKVEIIKSSPDKITFQKYSGPLVEKFTLIHTGGDQWLLLNHTHTKEINKFYSESPKLKVKDMSYNYKPKENDFILPKIDGAYSTTILRPNKPPVVLSSRISKRTGFPIEYTPKIYNIQNKIVPKELGNTVLRTEVYGVNNQNKEIPNSTLGGILNANVWKSREMQKQMHTPLRLAAFDIIKYKGKDVSNLPIEDKFMLLDEIRKQYPIVDNPKHLSKKVDFPEGKVVWRNNKPYKVKNKPDFDVYVRKIFPAVSKTGKREPMAGGIEYSWTPRGPIVGKVGTGWQHDELKDMYNNPDEYIGRYAKVFAMSKIPKSQALRAPSFNAWHQDK